MKQERRKRSQSYSNPLPPPTGRRLGGRASSGFRQEWARASLTIECALVLPLFFFGMTAMISLMNLYRLETEHLTKLCQNCKLAATYTYNPLGGSFDDIVLPDGYTFKPLGGILPVPTLYRANLVRVRTWNGKEHVLSHSSLTREPMVYVTASGKVYHTVLSCRYLNMQVTSISALELNTRRNASGKPYTPCEKCAEGLGVAPIVYVTAKGTRFHNDPACPSLKRNIRLVKASEVNLPPCSACG